MPEPGQLPLGEIARPLLDESDRFILAAHLIEEIGQLTIAQRQAGLLVVGIQLDDAAQMGLSLPRQAVLAAPFGQVPLGFDRVGGCGRGR